MKQTTIPVWMPLEVDLFKILHWLPLVPDPLSLKGENVCYHECFELFGNVFIQFDSNPGDINYRKNAIVNLSNHVGHVVVVNCGCCRLSFVAQALLAFTYSSILRCRIMLCVRYALAQALEN